MHFTLLRKKVVLWIAGVLMLVLSLMIVFLPDFPIRHRTNVSDDLPEILARKRLVALVHPSAINYFIYKAEPMGLQLEMLQEFCHYLGVKLTIISARSLTEGYRLLQTGAVDLVASDLMFRDRDAIAGVEYSVPYMVTRQVLVQMKPKNWRTLNHAALNKKLIKSAPQLTGKRIYAPGWSVLVGTDKRLPGSGVKVQKLVGVDPERMTEMVSQGEMGYAVMGEHIAMLMARLYPNVDIATPLSDSLSVGWAVRDSSPLLLDSLNKWMSGFIQTPSCEDLFRKYFSIGSTYARVHSRDFTIVSGVLSPFDKDIKQYSAQVGWDWRLVASLICQESRFDASVRSRVGAYGLMQLMPATLERYGLDSVAGAESQIRAGTKYLKILEKIFLSSVPLPDERAKFVLASYNIGAGHILDAQRLARRFGKDPGVWDGNVDSCLLMKSNPKIYKLPEVRNGYCKGTETFAFVREVMDRYRHYSNIVK